MLNEDKIRLMTSISMSEKKNGKDLAMVHKYFKGDFISLHLLRAFIGYTVCWCLVMTLYGVCRVEELFSTFSLMDIRDYFFSYAAWYAGGLFIYLLITFAVQYRRYRRAARNRGNYLAKLKALERRYDFQDWTKETRQGG